MSTLIVKLNAAGDVVRTTTLLRRLGDDVTWITARANMVLLRSLPRVRCLAWEDRHLARDRTYDLVISLEDEKVVAEYVSTVVHQRMFGACVDSAGGTTYTADSAGWFDLSLISRFGRREADLRKMRNRRTYQELLFDGLGLRFTGEAYVLPPAVNAGLSGDVALAPVAGPVWPMKGWAHYDALQRRLEADGLRVNVLPRRESLLQHLGDVANHRCLVSGDSLPMHLALGTGTRCVTLFNCTSPWEIHGYGLQTKIVSPLLERYFYQREYHDAATTAITLDQVYQAVTDQLRSTAGTHADLGSEVGG
jgi:hypothetical protein